MENNSGSLRYHFLYRHWKSKVAVLHEGPEPLPRCDQCGMHMPVTRLFKHRRTDKCNKVTERRLRQRDVEMLVSCGEAEFILYGEEGYDLVEEVVNFKYLGRNLYQTDDDWTLVR